MDLSSGSGQTITNNNNNFAYQLSTNKLPQQQPPAQLPTLENTLPFKSSSELVLKFICKAIKFLICCNDYFNSGMVNVQQQPYIK